VGAPFGGRRRKVGRMSPEVWRFTFGNGGRRQGREGEREGRSFFLGPMLRGPVRMKGPGEQKA